MRALSVRQPWADLEVLGLKPVENRTKPFPSTVPLPARIGIHASKALGDVADATRRYLGAHGPDGSAVLMLAGAPNRRGALVGFVTVTGCHHADECDHICPEHGCDECDDPTGQCGHEASWPVAPGSEAKARATPDAFWLSKCDVHGGPCENTCSPWAEPRRDDHTDVWHWTLANPEPLAVPVPMKGALGLWRLPAEVVA